jgi:hypothetical protein
VTTTLRHRLARRVMNGNVAGVAIVGRWLWNDDEPQQDEDDNLNEIFLLSAMFLRLFLHTSRPIDMGQGGRSAKVNGHHDNIRQLDRDRFERVVAALGNLDGGRRLVAQGERHDRTFFVVEDAYVLNVRWILEGKGQDATLGGVVRIGTVPVLADDKDVLFRPNVLVQRAGFAANADAGSSEGFIWSTEIEISSRRRRRVKDHGVARYRLSATAVARGADLNTIPHQTRHDLAGHVVFKVHGQDRIVVAQGQRRNVAVDIGYGARFHKDDDDAAHLRNANVDALVAIVAAARVANLRHGPVHGVDLDLDVLFGIEETDRLDKAGWIEQELEAASVSGVVRIRGVLVFGDDQDVALGNPVGKDRARAATDANAGTAKVGVRRSEIVVVARRHGRVEDHGLAGVEHLGILARLDLSNDADAVAEMLDHITRLKVGEVRASGVGGSSGEKAQEGEKTEGELLHHV